MHHFTGGKNEVSEVKSLAQDSTEPSLKKLEFVHLPASGSYIPAFLQKMV